MNMLGLGRTLRLKSIAQVSATRRFPIRVPTTQVRFAASSVSSQPASKDSSSAVRNAVEEVGHVAGDLAKTIAGGHTGDDVGAITRENKGHATSMSEDFLGLTSSIAAQVPKHIFVFGLAGSLPYLGTSISTLYLASQASHLNTQAAADLLAASANIQVTYGAVLLSFLGALHWGFEFSKYGGYKGYPRLWLGVAPMLAAWPTLAMEPTLALTAQWFLFTSLWYADMRVTTAGWTPRWYSQYRFYLSILVGGCIIGTLFGINYLGPTTEAALAAHITGIGGIGSSASLMDRSIREKAKGIHGGVKNFISADAEVRTEDTGDDGTAFVKLVKKPEPEEDEEEGEQEEGDKDKEREGVKAHETDKANIGGAGAVGENPTSAQDIQADIKSSGQSKGKNQALQGNGPPDDEKTKKM